MDMELHEVNPARYYQLESAGLPMAGEDDACANCMASVCAGEFSSQFTPYFIALADGLAWYLCVDCAVPAVFPAHLSYFSKTLAD